MPNLRDEATGEKLLSLKLVAQMAKIGYPLLIQHIEPLWIRAKLQGFISTPVSESALKPYLPVQVGKYKDGRIAFRVLESDAETFVAAKPGNLSRRDRRRPFWSLQQSFKGDEAIKKRKFSKARVDRQNKDAARRFKQVQKFKQLRDAKKAEQNRKDVETAEHQNHTSATSVLNAVQDSQ